MPVLIQEPKQGGPVAPPQWPGSFGDGGGSGDSYSSFPISKGQLGMWILMTGVGMLFAGLSSAYIVLRGVPDWQNIELPGMIWFNTGILIASSLTIEIAKWAARSGQQKTMKLWLGLSGLMGFGFLAGQILVWRELVAAGIYLPTTLHSSFFYVLTGLHGVHLLGGIVGMAIVLGMAYRNRLTPSRHEPLKLCAVYWHFMDGMWVYLLMLLMLA